MGDPVQLPATVISRRALEYNYDNSMFKRLQLAGYPVKILDTQVGGLACPALPCLPLAALRCPELP